MKMDEGQYRDDELILHYLFCCSLLSRSPFFSMFDNLGLENEF